MRNERNGNERQSEMKRGEKVNRNEERKRIEMKRESE
jgi:hypothetical protein